jgi:DNA-binding IclR family transcriptional regulator
MTNPDTRARATGVQANDYTIAAVDRAIALLEILGRIGPASLAKLAREAEMTRTGAFRLLRTMGGRGFVLQDGPRGSWRLGARLGALRTQANEQGALAMGAEPRMASLARDSGEVVYLAERADLRMRILAVSANNAALRRYAAPGDFTPLYAGLGRLLLAAAPETVQTQVLAGVLPRHTPATLTDPNRVAAELVRVRTRGWLITESEVEMGAVAIGVPVRDATGQVVAALSIVGPALRLRGTRPRALLALVQDAAQDISRLLGWQDRRMAALPAPPPGRARAERREQTRSALAGVTLLTQIALSQISLV